MIRNSTREKALRGAFALISIVLIVALSTAVITSAAGSADLSATDNTTTPNSEVTVNFEITNTDSDAGGYILSLTLPDGLDVTDTGDASGTWNAGEAKWLWQTIDAGASKSPSVTLSVPADATGEYAVEGTVKTADGVASNATAVITVESDNNAPKAALATNGSTATIGDPVFLDAGGSTDDGEIVEYRWDVDGDGQSEKTTSGPAVTHTFTDAGELTPSVTVVDENRMTDTAGTTLTVENDTSQPGDGEPLTISTSPATPGNTTTIEFGLTNMKTDPGGYILELSLPTDLSVAGQSGDGGTWNAEETKWLYQTIDPGESRTPEIAISVPEDASETYPVRAVVKTAEGVVADRSVNLSISSNETFTPFGETSQIDRSQLAPGSLSGKIHTETGISSDVSVELQRSTDTAYSLNLTAPDTVSNVTFYLQGQAISASQDLQNLTMYLDGEEHPFEVKESVGPGNSPWVAFNVPHFSTRTVTFTTDPSGANFSVSIDSTNAPVNAGETLRVNATVSNVGDVSDTQTVSVDVGALGTDSANVSLAGGNSTNLTLSVQTGAGDAGEYTATVSSEDDTASTNVTVLAPAEFTIDIVETNTLVEGEQLNVTAQVENIGDVSGTQTVSLDVGALGTDSADVTLAGGNSTNLTLSVGTAGGDAGTYTATVSSADGSESSNVTVLAPGAFTVDIIGVDTPVEGNQLNVTAEILNTGDVGDTQTIDLNVGALGNDSTQVTLSGANSTTVTLSVGTGVGDAGAYTATVSSADDTASANVTVLAPAEFTIDIVETNTPVEGERLNVTALVENIGDVGGTQTVSLDVGALGTDSANLTLGGGSSTNLTLSVGTGAGDAGEYTATVSSENDAASANVTVLAPAEFSVSGLNAPFSAVQGETITVNATISNVGGNKGTTAVEFVFAEDVLLNQTVTLDAGNATNVSFEVPTADVASGTYEHGVRAGDSFLTRTLTLSTDNATLSLEGGSIAPERVDESATVTHDVGVVFENVSQDGNTDRVYVTFPDAVAGGTLSAGSANVTTLTGGSDVSISSSISKVDGPDQDGILDTLTFAVSPDASGTIDVVANVSVDITWPAVDTDTIYTIKTAAEDSTTGNVSLTGITDVSVTTDTTCVNRAVAGPDGEISLLEIQTAINRWAEDTEVPNTGGQTISLPKIQTLINAWAEDQTVTCQS